MIIYWIYGNPTWLWGSILVVLFASTACVGLVVFHRLVHVDLRRAHNDLAGFTIAIIVPRQHMLDSSRRLRKREVLAHL